KRLGENGCIMNFIPDLVNFIPVLVSFIPVLVSFIPVLVSFIPDLVSFIPVLVSFIPVLISNFLISSWYWITVFPNSVCLLNSPFPSSFYPHLHGGAPSAELIVQTAPLRTGINGSMVKHCLITWIRGIVRQSRSFLKRQRPIQGVNTAVMKIKTGLKLFF
uniref:Uncharacterized protein n=1 Tax=Poecilia mexicana TaxID=48701 RepID=A0A3B3Y4Y3_9TELE